MHNKIRLALRHIPTAIIACAVLHNIAIDLNQNGPDLDEPLEIDEHNYEIPFDILLETGNLQRAQIVRDHFS